MLLNSLIKVVEVRNAPLTILTSVLIRHCFARCICSVVLHHMWPEENSLKPTTQPARARVSLQVKMLAKSLKNGSCRCELIPLFVLPGGVFCSVLALPSSALPLLHDGQEGQVGAAQVGSPSVLEDVADGPRQAAAGVVECPDNLAVQSQLQDQSIARQQDVVPAQRNHLGTHTREV